MPGFEIYLQFDSLEENPLRELRGVDLRAVREAALCRLNQLRVSTTLVVTVQRGLNDHELGRIVDYAVSQPCVRGVVFQPVQTAGRTDGFDPSRGRITLTEVRRRILQQTALFRPEDIIPVPCHPDALAMAYALKAGGKLMPLTSLIDPQILIEGGRNTIVFESDTALQAAVFKTFSTNHSPETAGASLRELLCCLPRVDAPSAIAYENVFRLIIMQFQDAASFDVRSVKKSCVHIAHPDGHRLIPFDTFNLFYRDELEHTRLGLLREAALCV